VRAPRRRRPGLAPVGRRRRPTVPRSSPQGRGPYSRSRPHQWRPSGVARDRLRRPLTRPLAQNLSRRSGDARGLDQPAATVVGKPRSEAGNRRHPRPRKHHTRCTAGLRSGSADSEPSKSQAARPKASIARDEQVTGTVNHSNAKWTHRREYRARTAAHTRVARQNLARGNSRDVLRGALG
jgi:hypothetical protein